MATLSNNDIARAIYQSSKDDKNFAPKVVSFLNRRHLLGKSDAILKQLNKIVNTDLGIMEVSVTSAKNLNEKTKLDLIHTLKHKYKAKEVKIKEKVDGKVLGGLRIEINDEVIDLTLRNKINKLQAYLNKE